MKADGAFVAEGCDGFEAFCALFFAVFFERCVEQLCHASASVVGVDADDVDVADGSIGCDKPEEEAYEGAVVFDDAGEFSEFVEEDGVREGACWAAPPAIDHADDFVVVGLFEWSRCQVHGNPLSSLRGWP